LETKVGHTQSLADQLAHELSTKSSVMANVQKILVKGVPYYLIGQFHPRANVAVIALRELLKVLSVPGLSVESLAELSGCMDSLQDPISVLSFETIASIDCFWNVRVMKEHDGSAFDGIVRRWCQGLGLSFEMTTE
jgi:hypothetical protein